MPDHQKRILKSTTDLQPADIRSLYDGFNSAIAELNCGRKCAPHNPRGKPFCCDICHAVPAAYKSEWNYLEQNTDLWRKRRFPLLRRDDGYYLVGPGSERLERVEAPRLPRFGVYEE